VKEVVQRGDNVKMILPAEPGDEGYFDGSLPLSEYLRPVCLPCGGFVTDDMLRDHNGKSLVKNNMSEDDRCRVEGEWLLGRHSPSGTTKLWVTGFGYTNYKTEKTPKKLQRTELKVEDKDACDDAIERMHAHVKVPDQIKEIQKEGTGQMFCTSSARNRKTDVCKGDSGGPFVRKVQNSQGEERLIQVGVVSWGWLECAEEDFPGFQGDITKAVGWIKQKTEEE